jgi:hypothetical protein
MKKIWYFLRHHISEDFNRRQYAVIAAFMIIIIAMNYTFDFEDDYLEVMTGYPKFMAYLFFYSLPYFFSVYIYVRFNKNKDIFKQTAFWKKSLFGVTLLALDSSMPYLEDVISYFFHPRTQYWAYKVFINGISFLTVALPILIFYYLNDREKKHFYGLRPHKFDARPYFTMLLIMFSSCYPSLLQPRSTAVF